jgi:hypothetical protein
MIRGPVVVVGIAVGLGVYSYGMFHTLLPTSANLADVGNCGVSPGAAYQAVDTRLPDAGDLPLCQVASGEWTKTPYGNGPLFLGLAIAFGCAMVAIHRSSFLKRMTRSATRTVFLFLLVFGVPMLLLGLHLIYVEGTLTLDWALHAAVYTLVLTAVFGLFARYTFSRGLRRRVSTGAKSSNSAPVDFANSVRDADPDPPGFKFRATYDLTSVEASARTLFKSYWRARRMWTLGALVPMLLTTALCWHYNAFGALWIIVCLAALNILIWPFQRWAINHRANRSLGRTADIRFTSSEFSISSPTGSYQVPWSRFLSTQLDNANLYLFVSNITAITVPTKNASAEAIEFARSQVH